eukprot:8771171-Pyramimonas_sp.AAC.1
MESSWGEIPITLHWPMAAKTLLMPEKRVREPRPCRLRPGQQAEACGWPRGGGRPSHISARCEKRPSARAPGSRAASWHGEGSPRWAPRAWQGEA